MKITRLANPMLAAGGALATLGIIALAPAAQASSPDSFYVETTDSRNCGLTWYVDYGPGADGGGSNDDYVEIHDYCKDGYGVKVWAWLTRNGTKYYLGDAYDGLGAENTSSNPYGHYTIWDPFKPYGNVVANDYVGLKVCLVNGNSDPTPVFCDSYTAQSVDG